MGRHFDIYIGAFYPGCGKRTIKSFRVLKDYSFEIETQFEKVNLPFCIVYMTRPELEALGTAERAKGDAKERELRDWQEMLWEAQQEDNERDKLAKLEAKYRAKSEGPSVPTPEKDTSDDGGGDSESHGIDGKYI